MSDPQSNLVNLLQYFGFPFDKKNMHRHCCVMKYPINTAIKREPSEIDTYKVSYSASNIDVNPFEILHPQSLKVNSENLRVIKLVD